MWYNRKACETKQAKLPRSHLFKFVKRFLKFIFWTAFQAFKIWFNSLSLLSKQLIYYITLFSFCQEVFQTFLKFFLDFRSLCDVFKPFSRQLLYYTLFVRKSQLLFQKYLKKFCTISFPSFTQNIRCSKKSTHFSKIIKEILHN